MLENNLLVDKLLDDLEIELRKKPGIIHIGFKQKDGILFIQVHVDENTDSGDPFSITKIANRHAENSIAVEIIKVNQKSDSETKTQNKTYTKETNTTQDEQNIVSEPTFNRRSSDQKNTKTEDADTSFTPPTFFNNEEETKVVKSEYIDLTNSFFTPEQSTKSSNQSIHFQGSNQVETKTEVEALDEDSILIITPNETSTKNKENLDDEYADLIYSLEITNVLSNAEKNEIEIHLSNQHQRAIGRTKTDSSLEGVVNATLDAAAQLTGAVPLVVEWAHEVTSSSPNTHQCSVSLSHIHSPQTFSAIARSNNIIEAATKATLQALMRYRNGF